jgi:hypothetical protein
MSDFSTPRAVRGAFFIVVALGDWLAHVTWFVVGCGDDDWAVHLATGGAA